VTIAVRHVENAGRFGGAQVDEVGQVTWFSEKATGSASALVNAGIYVCDSSLVDHIDDVPTSLERDVFPALVGRGLYAVQLDGFFTDIGVPEAYLAVNAAPRPLDAIAARVGPASPRVEPA
jgi:NDP-sugar pyrophosphorylase family protein